MQRLIAALSMSFFVSSLVFANVITDKQFYKVIFQNTQGEEMNLFGYVLTQRPDTFAEFYQANKDRKAPEMLDAYRYSCDEQSKDKTIKTFEMIGEAFALDPNALALKLSKEKSPLIGSFTSFINVEPKDKAMIVFFKKNSLAPKLTSDLKNPELQKAIEQSYFLMFAPQDTLPKFEKAGH